MPRRLLDFVPAFATLVAGYALLGPGRARPVIGCRVLVADDADGKLRSLRLQIVEHLAGIEEPRAMDGLRAFVDGHLVWEGSTAADGVIELRVAEPKEGPSSLVVMRGEAALASGSVGSPRTSIPRRSPEAHGTNEGAVTLRVSVPRGQLTPPFSETVGVVATKADGSKASGTVKLAIEGAAVAPETLTLSNGVGTASVIASVPPVELKATAQIDDGSTGSWSGELPVGVGSIWLDAHSTRGHLELAVRSPHAEAYVSLYDDRGRIGGLVVPLAVDPDGIYRGGADTDVAAGPPLTAVVATDPQERGLTTVAWPVDPPTKAFGPGPLRQVLDGIPDREAHESARMSRVRRITAAFLGAATLLEVALLLFESRRTRRDLNAHFMETAELVDEPLDEGVARPVSETDDGRVDTSRLVVPAKSTALVVITVGLLLALSALTLAALNFASS